MASSAAKKIGKNILLPYQQEWIEDRAPLKIWLAARQIGKSFTLSLEAVLDAVNVRCNNMLLSSSERQSREMMQKVISHMRVLKVLTAGEIKAIDETKSEVTLPNGSRIISLPANPATVRGFSGNVYLDEFAFHRDSAEIWRAMYPTVTRGFSLRVSSTANGKQNMFFRLWSDPESGFSHHKTSIHAAIAQGLDADITMLRKGINDPDAWAQEYECEFIDEATAFLPYELISSCEDDSIGFDGWEPKKKDKPELYLGMDIGRKRDLTVIWIIERVGDVSWTRLVKVLHKAPFRVQRDELYAMIDGSALGGCRVRRACIDSTGIGAQLAEEARVKFGSRVEPVTFSLNVKEDLAVTTRRAFEDRRIRIPADRDTRDDLHSVRKVTTPAGNIRFDAESTDKGHADRFWALALALHASGTPSQPITYERVSSRSIVGGGDGEVHSSLRRREPAGIRTGTW